MAGKRKTAQQSSKKVEELADEDRYTVVCQERGRRIYFGRGVAKDEAERLSENLVIPTRVVRVLDL